jgi:hypothetical protein
MSETESGNFRYGRSPEYDAVINSGDEEQIHELNVDFYGPELAEAFRATAARLRQEESRPDGYTDHSD